ncbi:hypothetical protein N7E02_04185 (plasmid) [Aliirhizobium terrae]|nr:HWE histidine kinase domain-containing protein [Rhizobium sp. CC-CFT758]WJH38856.1 hypothetical protein N7E02_04185 [Rhizobium sp. CC-CFT758]
MIGGILRIAARTHTTAKALVNDVESRVLALGEAHTLASNQHRTKPIELEELIHTILAPHSGSEIEIHGGLFPISTNCITPLTLILHEWATNAVKHGVLGNRPGSLIITWERNADKTVLTWNENGEDDVEDAGKAGFGTVLLSTSSRQLGATIETKIAGSIISHILTLPNSVRHDC